MLMTEKRTYHKIAIRYSVYILCLSTDKAFVLDTELIVFCVLTTTTKSRGECLVPVDCI